MIDGVNVKQLVVYPDIPDTASASENGFLMEILREDDHLMTKFGQTTFTVAHRGTIKAFHWHVKQDDLWFVASGRARIVLHDIRTGSRTFGQTDVLFAGESDYKLVVIPRGVLHGYQVVSDAPVFLFYHSSEAYNAADPDERRIAHDDPAIGFNWDSI